MRPNIKPQAHQDGYQHQCNVFGWKMTTCTASLEILRVILKLCVTCPMANSAITSEYIMCNMWIKVFNVIVIRYIGCIVYVHAILSVYVYKCGTLCCLYSLPILDWHGSVICYICSMCDVFISMYVSVDRSTCIVPSVCSWFLVRFCMFPFFWSSSVIEGPSCCQF